VNSGIGNDTVQGNIGDDNLSGNDGDDLLDGGSGVDEVWGGSGSNTVSKAEYGGRDRDRGLPDYNEVSRIDNVTNPDGTPSELVYPRPLPSINRQIPTPGSTVVPDLATESVGAADG
jgi:Ca2+-binding RTX toxin-like protein